MFKFLRTQKQISITQDKQSSLRLTNRGLSHNIKALLFILILFGANYALAQDAAAADALSPMLDKILNSLGGTLGKVIMAVGLLLSVLGALAGMNKAVILTPVGIGFLLGNAKIIIDWMFN